MIETAGFIGANYGGDDKLIIVHPSNIAEAADEELTKEARENSIRYIASDDNSARETAAIIGNAIGKPGLKWLAFTNEQSKEGMDKTDMPAHVVSNFVEMGCQYT